MNDFKQQAGVTLVELMVALSIGSFLMIGAVQLYSQSRHAFVINESIARVQETAQFAMDTIEADVRMASNWGRHSRGSSVVGRSVPGDANPLTLAAPAACGAAWALDVSRPVQGDNNNYGLVCPPDARLSRHHRCSQVACRSRPLEFTENFLLTELFRRRSIRWRQKRTTCLSTATTWRPAPP